MTKIIHTQKHMTLSDRIYIEQALAAHDTFKDIATVLKKDPSTISKEVRKHRVFKEGSHYHLKNNLFWHSTIPNYTGIICASIVNIL